MDTVFYKGKVIWAQVDPNQHMRHSAYADFAAQARMELFEKFGINASLFHDAMIGPILLKEELIYLREVQVNEVLSVSCEILKSKSDASRWTIKHELFKRDGVKAAIVTVEGAWIDLKTRKMTKPMDVVLEAFQNFPKSRDFAIES